VSFDFTHITHPDTGSEYINRSDAYEQWQREFPYDAFANDTDILGYATVDTPSCEDSLEKRWYVVLRFIVRDDAPMSDRDFVERLQTVLYDMGGLSGDFKLGHARMMEVKHTLRWETENASYPFAFTTSVLAVDERHAETVVERYVERILRRGLCEWT
jgi:hypothetical protein